MPSTHCKVAEKNWEFLSPAGAAVAAGRDVCPRVPVRPPPGTALFVLAVPTPTRAGHATSRGGSVGWTYQIIIAISFSSSWPFPGRLRKPPPCLEGVPRAPPHDLITGSWRAGMASGCMAPECALGTGAAQKSTVWHDVTAGERSGARSCGGWRHLPQPARQAPPPEPRRPQGGQKQKGH